MTVLAADRFHVAPWVLLERGTVWHELAVQTLQAERRAEAEINRRAERRRRMAEQRR